MLISTSDNGWWPSWQREHVSPRTDIRMGITAFVAGCRPALRIASVPWVRVCLGIINSCFRIRDVLVRWQFTGSSLPPAAAFPQPAPQRCRWDLWVPPSEQSWKVRDRRAVGESGISSSSPEYWSRHDDWACLWSGKQGGATFAWVPVH